MNNEEMQKTRVSGTVHTEGKFIKSNLFVIMFDDGNVKVAYCPALNVYGYGKQEQDARESFEICLTEFFDYSIKKKTLVAELESLGWTIKKQKKFTAPAFSSLLEKNKVLKKIMDTKEFKKINTPISLPAFA